jgi:hypothetical protein
MSYDPSKPPNGAPIVSAELREQFAGLKAEIDTKVSNADFESIIIGLSSGPVTTVGMLQLTVSNPPTQAEVQAVADKIDELLSYLKRL